MIRCVYSDLLHVGNALDARDLKLLYDHRIQAVVDLAINEKPAQLARELIYCRFPINDGGGNSAACLELALKSVCDLVGCKFRTLVVCSAGMSRAPSIAAGAISILCAREPDACLAEVVRGAPCEVSPQLWAAVRELCLLLSGLRASE